MIVLGSGNATIRFIENVIKKEKIELLGNIPDDSLGLNVIDEYKKKTKELNCNTLGFDTDSLKNADIIFSIEYRKVISAEYVNKHLFVNCHGGILPKWRGFACNAWAIMNRETEIGYSIHEINEKLDDGKLYFVKKFFVSSLQTYSDVHGLLIESIVKDSPDIIVNIAYEKCQGKNQKGTFHYCNKFTPQMGELNDFNKPAVDIVNLYRCMAKPLGTGTYFTFKGNRFDVGKIKDASTYGLVVYIGIPGKIINMTHDSLWVKTRDSGVILSDITMEGKCVVLSDFFRNGISLEQKYK